MSAENIPNAFLDALTKLTEGNNARTTDLQNTLAILATYIKEEKPVSAKLSDVDTFDGTDNSKFRPFVSQLTVFFETQPRRFPGAAQRINYTGNRLRGQAQEWFARNLGQMELVGTDMHVWPTWSCFLEQLRTLFGRRQEDQEVRRQLDRLTQRGRGVTEYLNEFERLQSIVHNPPETQAYMYRRGLEPWIKSRMIYFPYDTYTLEGAKQASLAVWQTAEDAKNEERAQPNRNRNNNGASTTTTSSTSWPLRAPAGPAAVVVVDDPMDISNVSRRGPLTAAEREIRMKSGACLYCGDQGHLLRECPKKSRTGAARSSPAPGSGN